MSSYTRSSETQTATCDAVRARTRRGSRQRLRTRDSSIVREQAFVSRGARSGVRTSRLAPPRARVAYLAFLLTVTFLILLGFTL